MLSLILLSIAVVADIENIAKLKKNSSKSLLDKFYQNVWNIPTTVNDI